MTFRQSINQGWYDDPTLSIDEAETNRRLPNPLTSEYIIEYIKVTITNNDQDGVGYVK